MSGHMSPLTDAEPDTVAGGQGVVLRDGNGTGGAGKAVNDNDT